MGGGSAFTCVPYPGVGERLANVEVSLRGHHDHAVHAASEGHLGEGEDEGGGDGLDAVSEGGGEGRKAIEYEDTTLKE